MSKPFEDIIKFITDKAPFIGLALGGPAGAVVGSLLSSTFSTDSSDPKKLLDVMTADPNVEAKLKSIENEHKEFIIKNASEMYQKSVDDIQNARTSNIDVIKTGFKLNMPAVISFITFILFILLVILEFNAPDHIDNHVFNFMCSAVALSIAQIVNFYFGATYKGRQVIDTFNNKDLIDDK